MRSLPPSALVLVLGFFACAWPRTAGAANWPSWRGPNGDGTTTEAHDLPVKWSLTENIKWKYELPAWSGSSPVVWGDRIFLNSPSKEASAAPADAATPPPPGKGKRGPGRGGAAPTTSGPGGQEILLLCLERATGKELWRRQFDRGNEIHMRQNSTSPSPVTDGKLVWTTSGNGMIACFDFAGNEKWKFDIPGKYGKLGLNHGYASSPLLLDNKLIVEVLHGMKTDDPSYLFALEKATGKVLWKVERPTDAEFESPDAYTTPTLLVVDGKKQIVVNGGDYITGHDADTGAELWRSGGLNPRKARDYRIVPSPVVRDGMIFAPTRKIPLQAFRAGGTGDISKSHLAWTWTQRDQAPDVPTPLCDGPRFYMIEDAGRITCLNAKTGEVIYGPHDLGIGTTSASPILADGKIYVTSMTAETAVIQAGPEFKQFARNVLDNSWTLSTPAFVDNEIFLRTATHLYCICNAK